MGREAEDDGGRGEGVGDVIDSVGRLAVGKIPLTFLRMF